MTRHPKPFQGFDRDVVCVVIVALLILILSGCSHTTAHFYPDGSADVSDTALLKDRAISGADMDRNRLRLRGVESDASVAAVKELGRIARP